jgi:hypothetical protein
MPAKLNADEFLKRLKALRSAPVAKTHDHLASDEAGIWGVRMGQVFALAKEFIDMPLDEVEKLLESPVHEARVGAVSIIDFQARSKKRSRRVEKNCSICISNAMTASTPGTWWTAVLLMSLADISSISRARCCISWRAPRRCQNAALRLSAPVISSGRGTWRIRSRSPKC